MQNRAQERRKGRLCIRMVFFFTRFIGNVVGETFLDLKIGLFYNVRKSYGKQKYNFEEGFL